MAGDLELGVRGGSDDITECHYDSLMMSALTQHEDDEDAEFEKFGARPADPPPSLQQLHQQDSKQTKQ